MDTIKYCEHKILLKPERLGTTSDFRRFWQAVKVVARTCDIRIRSEPDELNFGERKVMFFDTETADLYRNSFILRKRITLLDGLAKEHEVTFKFRNPDLAKARDVDVRSFGLGNDKMKFKEEILQPRDGSFGYRSLYSHNCVVKAPTLSIHRRFSQLKTDFPALGLLSVPEDAPVVLVQDTTVDEIEADTGDLDFGHDYDAAGSIAVWKSNGQKGALIGEFSFQTKFRDQSSVDAAARDRALLFFRKIQSDLTDWVAAGATKTSLIYGSAISRE